MKKTIVILFQLFLILFSINLESQTNSKWLTPGGKYDKVYDSYGNKYLLKNIRIDSDVPFDTTGASSNMIISSSIGYTCSQGYFDVYFQNGMQINGITTPTFVSAAQLVVCEVLKNISDFITTYSLSTLGAPRINLYVNSSPIPLLAAASPVYAFPASPINPNQGFIDNQMQKMLLTSIDPYTTIPLTSGFLNNNSPGFFHGYITLRSSTFGSPLNVSLNPPATNEYDLYSAVLHEIGHCLGIASLISLQGPSVLPFNNSYSRYDTKLFTPSGSPLLGTSNSSLCASNLTFTVPVSTIATATTGCIPDITTCSTAVQYSGGAVTLSVYTPNCFSSSSSLAHFEDMCSAPYNPTSCTPVPATPGYNNLYFAMSNVGLLGACGFKRYFKEEERKVLCDLGYTVSTTYSSTAILMPNNSQVINYSATCSPDVVVGQNDGLSNGIYIYTTTTNSFSIPTSSLLINDFPSTGLSVSCVEIIYTNSVSQHSAAVSGTNLIVNGTVGSGLAIVKYTPINSSGLMGNATYVFVYFVTTNCNPSNYCNMIQNGGFENSNGISCGAIGGFPSLNSQVNCWEEYPPGIASPSLYVRTCTTSTTFNLGTNTFGTGTNVVNSFNGTPNDKIIALTYTNGSGASAFKNHLSGPIVPGQQYNLSFWAINYTGSSSGPNTNITSNPIIITVACHSVFPFVPSGTFPAGLHTIAQFTIPAGTDWKAYAQSVSTPTNQTNLSALIIGIDEQQTDQAILGWTSGATAFCFLDQISLTPSSYPLFNLGTPTICGNAAYPDLSLYTPGAANVDFSGPSVNLINGLSSFNLSSYLPPGNYPIQASFTVGACSYTSYALVTVNSNTNFASLTNTVLCSNTPTLDLNNLLYTTPAVTGGTFYVNGTATTNIIGLTSPVNVTVAFTPTGTGLCSVSTVTSLVQAYPTATSQGFIVNSGPINGGSTNTHSTCGTETFSLSYNTNLSPHNYSINPGNIVSNAPISPSTSAVFTLSIYSNTLGLCPTITTLAVNVVTNCCRGTVFTPFSGTVIPTTTVFASPILIANDITIPNSLSLTFQNTEVFFLNNAKIIVDGGGILYVRGSHLYSCDNNMWTGIEVKDGGGVEFAATSSYDNLIEDALKAIDVTNNTTNSTILEIHNTTFNKNYIGINISNYTQTVIPYPFYIDNCVFTCRDLPSNSSAWPNVKATSTLTGTAAQLRTALSLTTDLTPPYLSQSNFTITNLKNPYSNQPSHIAINLSTVGVNSGTIMYGINIGTTTASNFNLFDAHGTFISAENSNVLSKNNVFQNTRTYSTSPNGAAIYHSSPGVMITKLDLTSSTVDEGNRFWDCHQGILGNNTYRFNIEKAIFRSAQNSTTTINTYTAGKMGINLPTNRFSYYAIDNEFTNINTCINVPIAAGAYTTAATGTVVQNGIYASHLIFVHNTFSLGTGSSNYINRVIDIASANTTSWTMANNYNIIPSIIGVRVQGNEIKDAYRGVYVYGMTGFSTIIEDNTIVLDEDNVYSFPLNSQHGIDLSNAFGTNNVSGLHIINGNSVSSASPAVAASSSLASLIYCGSNTGVLTPSVCCNNVSDSYNGFVFESSNDFSIWGGNKMTLPLIHGMELYNSGVIGAQGSTNTASNNDWNGGTWNTPNFGTNVINSIAQNSKLYVKSGSTYPPNPTGNIGIGFQYGGFNTLQSISGGDYTCGDNANYRVVYKPNSEDFESEESFYIAKTSFYRFLHLNDSVRDSDSDLTDFYEDESGGTIGKFMQIEEYLYSGNTTAAAAISNSFSTTDFNFVELNYKSFYDLSIKRSNNTFDHSDNASLLTLANLCPGIDGPIVYQARALYNHINKTALNYPDCELAIAGARTANNNQNNLISKTWNVDIFPNPATNQITLESTGENEHLNIVIKDLSNRIVFVQNAKTKQFLLNLDLDLVNGAYLITINNAKGEKITKKLLIAH